MSRFKEMQRVYKNSIYPELNENITDSRSVPSKQQPSETARGKDDNPKEVGEGSQGSEADAGGTG